MKSYRTPAVLVLACAFAAMASAADPWISVPSTPTSDQRMLINGGNLAPNAVLTVRVQHPSGAVTTHRVNAGRDGRLQFAYALPTPGAYGVEVFDAGGQPLAQGRLGHFR